MYVCRSGFKNFNSYNNNIVNILVDKTIQLCIFATTQHHRWFIILSKVHSTHITCDDDQLSANVKPNPYFNLIPACSGVACLRVGNHHPGLVKATNVLTIHMGVTLTSGLWLVETVFARLPLALWIFFGRGTPGTIRQLSLRATITACCHSVCIISPFYEI